MDAGEQAFAEKGFYGAAVEEIAERAGFSSGAFYSNFQDKEELFLALFDRRAETQITEIGELLRANPGPEAFYAALRDRNARRGSERTWFMLGLEFVLYALRTPHARLRLAERERASRLAYARGAAAQYEALGLPLPASAHEIGLILQALDHGFALEEYVDPETVSMDAFVDALELLLKMSTALAEQTARPSARNPT
jgi:AcrR family transcriptional regulator